MPDGLKAAVANISGFSLMLGHGRTGLRGHGHGDFISNPHFLLLVEFYRRFQQIGPIIHRIYHDFGAIFSRPSDL